MLEGFNCAWALLGHNASQIQTLIAFGALIFASFSIKYIRKQIRFANEQRLFDSRIKLVEYCNNQLEIGRKIILNNKKAIRMLDAYIPQLKPNVKEAMEGVRVGLVNASECVNFSMKNIELVLIFFKKDSSLTLKNLEIHFNQTSELSLKINQMRIESEDLLDRVEKFKVK